MALYDLVDGVVTFKPQYSLNSRGQIRFSKLFIRFVDAPGELKDSNWGIEDEVDMEILQSHLDGDEKIPEKAVSAIWSETGQEDGKTLRSAPTYVRTGKNLGKKNATNVLSQAISDATSKWNKNARKGGYVTDKDDLNTIQSGRIKPMALSSLPPQSPEGKFDIADTPLWKEGDPVFIAPKVDGNRMVADKDGFWGRSGDTPPNPFQHIRDALDPFFKENKDVILDGEIYKHGMEHQLINGIYMDAKGDSSKLQYWVFDIILPDRKADYNKRIAVLRNKLKSNDVIVLVDSKLVSSSDEIKSIYKQHLKDGYEGSVLRHPHGVYELAGRKEKRSKTVLKLKPVYDSEFEIVGYKDGKGRDSGALMWTLKMPDSDTQFNARPCMTIEDRRELFKQMSSSFETEYKGKMMRVMYGDTTKDGVPRFPRAVGVRVLPATN